MKLRKYFEYQPDLELTVAQIGINKWDWVATNRYDKGYAKRIMSLSRFERNLKRRHHLLQVEFSRFIKKNAKGREISIFLSR